MISLRKLFPRPGFAFLIGVIGLTVIVCLLLIEIVGNKTALDGRALRIFVKYRGELPTDPGIVAIHWSAPGSNTSGNFDWIETPLEIEALESDANYWWRREAVQMALKMRPDLYVGGTHWLENIEGTPQVMLGGSAHTHPNFRVLSNLPPGSENPDDRLRVLGQGFRPSDGRNPQPFEFQDISVQCVEANPESESNPWHSSHILAEAARVHQNLPARSMYHEGNTVILGKLSIPVTKVKYPSWRRKGESYGFLPIPLSGPDRYRGFHAQDIAAGLIPPSEIEDRIVADFGISDQSASNGFGTISYEEYRAQQLDAFLHGRILNSLPVPYEAVYLAILSLLAALIIPRLRGGKLFLSLVAGSVAVFGLPVAALRVSGLLLPLVTAEFIWIGSAATGIFITISESTRQRDLLKKLFGRYLSRQVMDAVLEAPELMKLEGREEVLTVFTSDIRGFTTLAESLEPAAVAEMLNEYFDRMIDIAFRNEGTLDKLVGDAIVVYFGNPVSTEDHADRAVKTAIEMKQALAELRAEWKKRGLPAIDCGIGIHTGNVFVGNVGASEFQSYTVIGENVQRAYSLQAQAKLGEILISEETRKQLAEKYRLIHIPSKDGLEECFEVKL